MDILDQSQQLFLTIGMNIYQCNKMLTLHTLRFYRGNKTTTANVLGISIRTLDAWLESYEEDAKILKEKQDERAREEAEYLRRARGLPTSAPQQQAHHYAPSAGVRVESAPQATPQHSMPMPESEEVQEVLLSKSNGRRAKKIS